MIRLPQLDAADPEMRFPDPRYALREPDGLLAFGGDLSPARLLAAYGQGIFPWFNADDPILWWSPDPRCVFRTADLKPNRSLRRLLARHAWRVSVDRAFNDVIDACAKPRKSKWMQGEPGTWIVPAMRDAYVALHALGHAHSVEVWDGEHLIGGIYGVAVGKLFCGESMFSRESGASKVALIALGALLRAWEFPLLDAQVANPHLLGLGALEIPRAIFLAEVARLTRQPGIIGSWSRHGMALGSGIHQEPA